MYKYKKWFEQTENFREIVNKLEDNFIDFNNSLTLQSPSDQQIIELFTKKTDELRKILYAVDKVLEWQRDREEEKLIPCKKCEGTCGRVEYDEEGQVTHSEPCSNCKGRGWLKPEEVSLLSSPK